MISDFKSYQSQRETYELVTNEYKTDILKMDEHFISEYDKTIADNTIKDLNTINDKIKINTAKYNLNQISKTIETEKNTITTKKQCDKYNETINGIIKSYDERLASIDKAEQEALEQAEAKHKVEQEALKQAEVKHKAEQEAKPKQAQQPKTGTPQKSTTSNSSILRVIGHRKCYGQWHSYTDFGADLIQGTADDSTTYHDDFGNHWDEEGNLWTSKTLELTDEDTWYTPEYVK